MRKKREFPTEEQYEEAEKNLAISFCPDIYPCKKCGWPVITGYCCSCGASSPSTTIKEDIEFEKLCKRI